MRNKLPYLACLPVVLCAWVFAQEPAEKPAKTPGQQADKPTPKLGKLTQQATDSADDKAGDKPGEAGRKKLGISTEAGNLLDQAIVKVEALPQFRCDLRQVTEMLGYRFSADGQYAIGPDYRMLYELKVQLTDTTGTIKEVCDGRYHWKNQKIFDDQQLTKLDFKKILDILNKPQFNKDARTQLIQGMGFSGMVPMMTGLRDSQKFETFDEQTLDDEPVYVLHGEWNETVISQASFRGQQLSLAKLPPYMPNKSTAWIGRENGWLYKVEMESTQKVQGSTTKITLEFLNPQIGVELPPSTFEFEPPSGVKVQDQTETVAQRLNLFLQQTQTQTKSTSPSSGGNPPPGEKSKAKPPAGSEPAKPALGLQP
jgi:hypothetical protein